jgi:hypothetical protein
MLTCRVHAVQLEEKHTNPNWVIKKRNGGEKYWPYINQSDHTDILRAIIRILDCKGKC